MRSLWCLERHSENWKEYAVFVNVIKLYLDVKRCRAFQLCVKKIIIQNHSFHTKKLNILIYLHYSDLFLNIVSISIPRAIFSYALIFFRRDLKLLATGMSRSECGIFNIIGCNVTEKNVEKRCLFFSNAAYHYKVQST